ncbi:hypothetical protein KIW84_035429 [Lathyrus oleraceus]|uniref:Gag-pro-like protein n=1 Tax=Pisum sativum TaxID=3888 RepID=A0A9D4Y3M3_PEA|nr:hypothetical protein KIW84_035429 [Pisum sativum]
MEETKRLTELTSFWGPSLDSMTTNFQNQVVIDGQVEDILKEDNKEKVVAGFPPLLPQEQRVLPHQRPAQNHQKLKQKQINKGNKDQEGRRPRYDPIPMNYAHLLPILVKAGAIVPKQIEPAKFPYNHKHDPYATCGYHAGYVGHSTETCHVLRDKIQELTDQKLLSFTPVITEGPVEKRKDYTKFQRRMDSKFNPSSFMLPNLEEACVDAVEETCPILIHALLSMSESRLGAHDMNAEIQTRNHPLPMISNLTAF